MSLKKQFLKSKPVCKVTFKVAADQVEKAKKVALLGTFNDWNPTGSAMKKLKDGSFTKTLDLETGKEYQFRYLVDGKSWINDDEPDAYTHSGVAAEQNSVVSC